MVDMITQARGGAYVNGGVKTISRLSQLKDFEATHPRHLHVDLGFGFI